MRAQRTSPQLPASPAAPRAPPRRATWPPPPPAQSGAPPQQPAACGCRPAGAASARVELRARSNPWLVNAGAVCWHGAALRQRLCADRSAHRLPCASAGIWLQAAFRKPTFSAAARMPSSSSLCSTYLHVCMMKVWSEFGAMAAAHAVPKLGSALRMYPMHFWHVCASCRARGPPSRPPLLERGGGEPRLAHFRIIVAGLRTSHGVE